MTTTAPLSGSELVLVAQVPKAGARWHQVHLNIDIARDFFRVEQSGQTITLEHIDDRGHPIGEVHRPLVFSQVNLNTRIEFDFTPITEYPAGGPPLLLVAEISLRRFRYLLLCPGDPGYDEMIDLNASLPRIGRGRRRVITTLDEVELRWPDCPLRRPIGKP